MATRGAVRRFNDFAARRPARWQQAVLTVMAVFLPVSVWEERGALVGLIAFAVYTPLFLLGAFRHEALMAWGPRLPGVEGVMMALFTFLGVAFLTELPLWECAIVGAGAGALLVAFGLRRDARTRARAGG